MSAQTPPPDPTRSDFAAPRWFVVLVVACYVLLFGTLIVLAAVKAWG